TLKELSIFINETEDIVLDQGLKLVDEFGDKLLTYVNELKAKVVDDRDDAQVIYTTAHKSKGMEYDRVEILEDFKTRATMVDLLKKTKPDMKEGLKKYLNEEINLLYVAITRSKGVILLPEELNDELTGKK